MTTLNLINDKITITCKLLKNIFLIMKIKKNKKDMTDILTVLTQVIQTLNKNVIAYKIAITFFSFIHNPRGILYFLREIKAKQQ